MLHLQTGKGQVFEMSLLMLQVGAVNARSVSTDAVQHACVFVRMHVMQFSCSICA